VNAGYTEYTCLHMFLISGELAFERAHFDEALAQFSSALEHCRSNMPERALVARLWHDFLLVETGRPSQAVTLLGLSARELDFDSDFCDFFFRALNYQLRLQAQGRDWPAARATLARLEPLVMRTGNALWMSWLAESAAGVAHELGRGDLAANFLARSRALQLERGFTPTPRQTASWQGQQSRLQHALPRCTETTADALAAMLERLQFDRVQSSRKPSRHLQRQGITAAHELPKAVEGLPSQHFGRAA
jgi:hypothetical protein